jgi:NitT/TauT family transport system permease protein
MTARVPVAQREQRIASALSPVLLPVLGLGALLLFWWAGTTVLPADGSFLRRFAPDQAFTSLRSLVESGTIWPALLVSLRRVLVGLAISAAVGIPVGLLVGSSRMVTQFSSGTFQFLRMISPLSWTPLAIVLFGVGDMPVYFLVAIGAVWPVIINTAAGVAALDPRWLAVGRSLGAGRWELVTSIVWPGIRSHVLTGLRLAVGLAWIILVPAEMLGVDSGLGYLILDSRDRLAYGDVMAVIIVIGLCGCALDLGARWLFRTRRAAPGRRRVQRDSPEPAQSGYAPVPTESSTSR